jgi:pilus assembly protein Flp/PilA
MKTLLARFAKDESGATAIEYGLIATLIAVAIIVGAGMLGTSLNTMFEDLGDCVGDPDNCPIGAGAAAP